MGWTTLVEWDELQPDQGRCVDVDGFELAIFLHAGSVYVLDDRCPHAGASLGRGYVDNGCAICPSHFWAFELKDGTLRGSGGMAVKTYPARTIDRSGKRFVQADLPRY